MSLSRRTNWPLAPNALSEALERRRAAGLPILDLTDSNPTRCDLAFCEDPGALLAAPLDRGALYLPEPFGRLESRQAVADWLRRSGSILASDRICLTCSTSEAYAYLFKLLCDPGDAVLVPQPSYPLFAYLAGLEGVAVHAYPLRYDGRWHIDRDALRSALGPSVKALVAVHPANPTGHYLETQELDFVANLCAERGIALISDEVFYEYALAPDRQSRRAIAGSPCLTFALGGLSKLAGLPQLKLAWIAADGPDSLVQPAWARLEIIADTYLSVGGPVQAALPEILRRAPDFQRRLLERLRSNLAVLESRARPPVPFSVLTVEGGWCAVLRLPSVQSSEAWALQLLERAGLLTQPGYLYDFDEEAYLVLSLLVPPDRWASGIERLAAQVEAALRDDAFS